MDALAESQRLWGTLDRAVLRPIRDLAWDVLQHGMQCAVKAEKGEGCWPERPRVKGQQAR